MSNIVAVVTQASYARHSSCSSCAFADFQIGFTIFWNSMYVGTLCTLYQTCLQITSAKPNGSKRNLTSYSTVHNDFVNFYFKNSFRHKWTVCRCCVPSPDTVRNVNVARSYCAVIAQFWLKLGKKLSKVIEQMPAKFQSNWPITVHLYTHEGATFRFLAMPCRTSANCPFMPEGMMLLFLHYLGIILLYFSLSQFLENVEFDITHEKFI